jgi:hypothetical protein
LVAKRQGRDQVVLYDAVVNENAAEHEERRPAPSRNGHLILAEHA